MGGEKMTKEAKYELLIEATRNAVTADTAHGDEARERAERMAELLRQMPGDPAAENILKEIIRPVMP